MIRLNWANLLVITPNKHCQPYPLEKTATIENSGKDRYGRTLGYIFIEGQTIDTMMVRMGMAWWYRRYDTTGELENAERYAKENKIGL